jgi:hypothetical protein
MQRVSIGKTLGAFIYRKSHSGLLRRLKKMRYNKTLVAASASFVLSGSKWNDARIYFRHNPDKFEYFHEVSKSSWETYGVMVYQEDVIKRLHYGGLTAMAIFLEEPSSAEKDVR